MLRMNIWGMLMLRMNICECINECKNEYWEMLMLRMNIWGMLMLGVNVGMGEC